MKRILVAALLGLSLLIPTQSHASEVVDHAVGDIYSTFGSWPILLIAGGGLASTFAYTQDSQVDRHFSKHHHLEDFDTAVDFIGKPYIANPAALAFYGVGLLSGNERFILTGETLIESLIFTQVMVGGIKLSVGRQGPDGSSNSFPSNHTAMAFDVASVMQSMYGWMLGVPCYLIAGAVGFSRVDGSYHHLSDVVFGSALGTAIGLGTSLFHNKKDTNLLISPILSDTRGAMLSYKF